jgi:hypothetical protein
MNLFSSNKTKMVSVISLLLSGAASKEYNERSQFGDIFKLEDDSLIIQTPQNLDDIASKGIPIPDSH